MSVIGCFKDVGWVCFLKSSGVIGAELHYALGASIDYVTVVKPINLNEFFRLSILIIENLNSAVGSNGNIMNDLGSVSESLAV